MLTRSEDRRSRTKTASSLGVLVAVLVAVTLLGGTEQRTETTREPPVLARRSVPGRDDTGCLLEHRSPVCDRPAGPGGGSVRRTSATSSQARRPSTWASSTSRSTTPRWRSRAATPRTPQPPRRHHTRPLRPRSRPPPTTRSAGLQPQLGADQTILDDDYASYISTIPDGKAKANGIKVGAQAAATVLALRANDGRGCSTTLADLGPPAPGPGVWQPAPGPVLGLCLPGSDRSRSPARHSSGPTAPRP